MIIAVVGFFAKNVITNVKPIGSRMETMYAGSMQNKNIPDILFGSAGKKTQRGEGKKKRHWLNDYAKAFGQA